MEIDEYILSALQTLAEDTGKMAEIAKKEGIYGTNITRWKDRKVQTISEKLYESIYPYLEPYLPKGPKYWPRIKLIQVNSKIEEKLGQLIFKTIEKSQKYSYEELKRKLSQELKEESEPFMAAIDYLAYICTQSDQDRKRIKHLNPDERTLMLFWSKLENQSKSKALRLMNRWVFEQWEKKTNPE